MPRSPALTALLAASVLCLVACKPDAAAPAAPAAKTGAASSCARPADAEAALAEAAAFEAAAIARAKVSRGEGVPALWTLRDADTTIHIFGTVHLLRPEVEWRTPEIEAAIAAADTIMFEADTSGPEAQRALSAFALSEGLFQDGTQLTSLLTGAEAERLEKGLSTIDLPVSAIQTMKPWFAAINISVFQMIEGGFDPEAGVENQIEADVSGRDVDYAYLETVEQQLGEFAGLDMCTQIEFLMMTVESLDQGTELLDLLVAEWADGDMEGLAALMASPEAFGSEVAYDALLKNRNERWVSLIEDLLDAPGTKLVAVGAGHLAGPDSVITMLESKGMTVEGP